MRLVLGGILGIAWLVSFVSRAEESSTPRLESTSTMQQEFSDDFTTTTFLSDDYEVKGHVTWEDGGLQLAPGTSISRVIDGGEEVRIDLTISFPPMLEDDQSSELQLKLSSDMTSSWGVVWAWSRREGHEVGELSILETVPQIAFFTQERTARQWTLDPADLSGNWQVRYRFGLVTIHRLVDDPRGDEESLTPAQEWHAAPFVEPISAGVKTITLNSKGQSPPLQRLSVSALPRRELAPEAARRLARTSTLKRSIGQLYFAGHTNEALSLQREVVRVTEEILAADHPDHGISLGDLGLMHHMMGNFDQAEEAFQKSRRILETSLGTKHPAYGRILGNLVLLHQSLGNYRQAESLCLESCEIFRSVLGEESSDYVRCVGNLALLYQAMGDFARAEVTYRQAIELMTTVHGEEHPDYAKLLTMRATLHYTTGQYARAEALFLKADQVLKLHLTEKHPYYVSNLIQLASLYQTMGDMIQAERYSSRAHETAKKLDGYERNPLYAESLGRLAILHQFMGDLPRAEQLYVEAGKAYEKSLGEEHPTFARHLNSFALLHQDAGNYDQAESLLRKALKIRKEVQGVEHPDYAASLNNLALLYRSVGRHDEAQRLQLKAQAIRGKVLGEDHPEFAQGLNNLAGLHILRGDYGQAERLSKQAMEIQLRQLATTLPWLPEAQAVAVLQSQTGSDTWLSIARELREEITPLEAWSAVWRTRGLALAMLAERHLWTISSPTAAPLADALQSVQRQLAQQTWTIPETPQRQAVRRRQMEELQSEKERLERELAAVNAEFRESQQWHDVGPEDLLARLPDGTALVNFAEVTLYHAPRDGKGDFTRERHYEAFIARPAADDSEEPLVIWVSLGPTEPIQIALHQWRGRITQRDGDAGEQNGSGPPHILLRRLLWEPIEEHLRDCTSVILIPEGELTVLPWAALPGRQTGTYLLEDYALSSATHGRQLYAALSHDRKSAGGMLLVGGVDYDRREPLPKSELTSDEGLQLVGAQHGHDSALLGIAELPFLPGTMDEIEQLGKISPQPPAPLKLAGSSATEQAVRAALVESRYVHLATHGFFADPKFLSMFAPPNTDSVDGSIKLPERAESVAVDQDRARLDGILVARNPLTLTGIALAGANLPPKTDDLGLPMEDDGILTGEEIVGLDLRGNELVVLSACETGLGAIGGGGEGVFGLQRAFHLAGAPCVVASLWNVDDKATRALMVEFYRNLWEEKLDKRQALRQAQLAVMTGYDPEAGEVRGTVRPLQPLAPRPSRPDPGRRLPPYYWAAFVLSGDWR